MQTFLPFADFEESAQALDTKRLGKQRIEGRQILRALEQGGGWSRHPATLMWSGYELALRLYIDAIDTEWIGRGYKHTLEPVVPACFEEDPENPVPRPWWLGDVRVHESHRRALAAKDPKHYASRVHADGTDPICYFWPDPMSRNAGRWGNDNESPAWWRNRFN